MAILSDKARESALRHGLLVLGLLSDGSMMIKSLLAGIAILTITHQAEQSRCRGSTLSLEFDDPPAYPSYKYFEKANCLQPQCGQIADLELRDLCQPINTVKPMRSAFTTFLIFNQSLFVTVLVLKYLRLTTLSRNKQLAGLLVGFAIIITCSKFILTLKLSVSKTSYKCDRHEILIENDTEPVTVLQCLDHTALFDVSNRHPNCMPCNGAVSDRSSTCTVLPSTIAMCQPTPLYCDCDYSIPTSVQVLVSGFMFSAIYLITSIYQLTYGLHHRRKLIRFLQHGSALVKFLLTAYSLISEVDTAETYIVYNGPTANESTFESNCSPRVSTSRVSFLLLLACILTFIMFITLIVGDLALGNIDRKHVYGIWAVLFGVFTLILVAHGHVRAMKPGFDCHVEPIPPAGDVYWALCHDLPLGDHQRCSDHYSVALPKQVSELLGNVVVGTVYLFGLSYLLRRPKAVDADADADTNMAETELLPPSSLEYRLLSDVHDEDKES
eukprot:m.5611 g.5611  ORF g.5611 m.5611 type:complete len:498 (+) comp7815_c0_seq1:67-1560(+)